MFLNLLIETIMCMTHGLFSSSIKYQAVIQRKGEKSARNQQKKIQPELLCEMYLIVLFIVTNIE